MSEREPDKAPAKTKPALARSFCRRWSFGKLRFAARGRQHRPQPRSSPFACLHAVRCIPQHPLPLPCMLQQTPHLHLSISISTDTTVAADTVASDSQSAMQHTMHKYRAVTTHNSSVQRLAYLAICRQLHKLCTTTLETIKLNAVDRSQFYRR